MTERCERRFGSAHPEDSCQRIVATGKHRCMLDKNHEPGCVCICGVDGPRR